MRPRRGRAPRPPRDSFSLRTKLTLVAGLTLVLVGVSTLGYVGWQYEGTNYVSRKNQATATEVIERAWSAGNQVARVEQGTVTSLVRIPRFGPDYLVPLIEGTDDAALSAGFGHFSSSARPGAVGNFALAGHRITHGEPLRRMPELQPGDEIIVETAKRTYVYVLDTGGSDLVVPMTAMWVVDPLPTNPDSGIQPAQLPRQRLISLTTCAELWHTDDRMVAFGHLRESHPRSDPLAG